MPYDKDTGLWKPEDDSVDKQVNTLLTPDNPFVMAAKTGATKAANKRGLINSSLAVGAGEEAAIKSVLPIAQQNAGQINAKNLSGQGYTQSSELQKTDIAGAADRLKTQIASNESMQAKDIQAQNDRLVQQLGSAERLNAANAAAEKERLGMQLTADEKRQVTDLNAAKERLGIQVASQEKLQANDIAAQNERLAQQLGSQERLAAAQVAAQKEMQGQQLSADERRQVADLTAAKERLQIQLDNQNAIAALDANTRTAMNTLDRETQERIANMQLSAGARQSIITQAIQISSTYASELNSITSNTAIPADARDALLRHIAAQRDSDLSIIEQIGNVDLEWTTAGALNLPATPAQGLPAPAPAPGARSGGGFGAL